MATTRAILQHFETWEKAQFDFLELVAGLIPNPLVRYCPTLIFRFLLAVAVAPHFMIDSAS